MKKFLLLLFLVSSLFGADAANDLLLTQRNSGNTGNTQRNLTATANTLLGWNGTTITNITAGTGISIAAGVITATGSGTGTVTSVSVATANGVSGTVATATTTPAITLILGAIVPTSVNGNTITTGTGTLTLGSATLNAGAGGTLGSNAFTSTTYAPLASPSLTGVPTAPTATLGTNTTQLATTAFVLANATGLTAITAASPAASAGLVWQSNGTDRSAVASNTLGLISVNLLTRTGTSTNNAILGVISDSNHYNLLTFNNVATLAGALGVSGGGDTDTNLYLRVPTTGTVTALVNNTVVGGFSSTGLNNTVIGATTPLAATFTTIASNSLTNLRTSKSNFNIGLNVKDYGAVGNGSSDDTAAIAAAVTALPSTRAVLYFPSGTYVTDAFTITGKTGLTVQGDGNGSSVIKSRTGSVVMNVTASTGVTVRNLTFDGNCSVRTAGQTAVSFDVSNNLIFTNNTIKNAGQYNVLVGGSSTQNTDINITNNVLLGGYADGINLQNVSKGVIADNTIDGVDDDCIAIGYNGSGFANQLTVIGNYCRARSDLGTNTGRGIWVGKAQDILIEGNTIDTIKQTGIWISDDGTGTRPARISVKGNKVRNVATSSGHGIAVYKADYVTLEGNTVENPAQGNCIEIADWQHLTIKGGTLTQTVNTFCRGIHADESASWSASWNDIIISNVDIRMVGASTNLCIYLAPDASVTMNTGCITETHDYQVTAGAYLYVDTTRGGTLWKIGNNTALFAGGSTLPATSTGIFTVFNNN